MAEQNEWTLANQRSLPIANKQYAISPIPKQDTAIRENIPEACQGNANRISTIYVGDLSMHI